MIAIALLVLGIVFVIALFDMFGGGDAPFPSVPAQGAPADANGAPPR